MGAPMTIALELRFVAPVPQGNRVQVLSVERWITPIFGGAPHWDTIDQPIVVDLDTGVTYCHADLMGDLIPFPLGLKPNRGCRISATVEGRVTSCMVASVGGDNTTLRTFPHCRARAAGLPAVTTASGCRST